MEEATASAESKKNTKMRKKAAKRGETKHRGKSKAPRRSRKSGETLQLWCTALGAGGVFSIKIPCNADGIEEIGMQICKKQHYYRIYGFDHIFMPIYLAQKPNGEWVKDDPSLGTLITYESCFNFKQIRAPEDVYFRRLCEEQAREPYTIHVLVQLPEILLPYGRAVWLATHGHEASRKEPWKRTADCPEHCMALRPGRDRDVLRRSPIAIAYPAKRCNIRRADRMASERRRRVQEDSLTYEHVECSHFISKSIT